MIVLGASVLANALADESDQGRTARAEIRGAGVLYAPDVIDVETAAVLRKSYLAGRLSEARFEQSIHVLQRLDLERVPSVRLLRRVFELRDNVGSYDAVYVALAEAVGCDLLTADRRLAGASGVRCGFRVLG